MTRLPAIRISHLVLIGAFGACFAPPQAAARNPIRQQFFNAYPQAVNSRLDRINGVAHCGVCHYDFSGGGPRNPYGLAVEATPNRSAAEILALGNTDSDGDGFSNAVEILDPQQLYGNIPTFPGLTAGNVGQVSNISIGLISPYLTPVAGADVTPPQVTVLTPNGGEVYTSSTQQAIQWNATDNSGTVVSVDVHVTFDGGAHWTPLLLRGENSGSLQWFVPNRPTTVARVRVTAYDPDDNAGSDQSNAAFRVNSAAGGRVPTTLRDFDMPGTQPLGGADLLAPDQCATCHGYYNEAVEPFFNWQGSMMAHASYDPLFLAALDVANLDAPESGDLCLRCHDSRGWLAGRSTPTDGSAMQYGDLIGVSCNLCHRMVDPNYEPGNPPLDPAILDELEQVPANYSNGQMVIDPNPWGLRGPFQDAVAPHEFYYSPFHLESAFCGTCHDVSNPVFVRNPDGSYSPNAFNAPAAAFGSHQIGPVERTYSEWFYSAFNTPQGVYAPQFGGNRDYVSSCQHCHMRAVTGQGCGLPIAPERTDLALHDMTGGSAWMTSIMDQVEPGADPAALAAGAQRARYLLQNSAELALSTAGDALTVRVTNQTGHKLPTGYPEGRRMWLNVRFYDGQDVLLSESGAYDAATGVLTHDAAAKVYEAAPVISPALAPVVGLPAGSEFHFVLNDTIHKDNRIPPQGFTNADYYAFGGAPVGATYADGQNWDETTYAIPSGAARVEVVLYYQSTSKEYVEFLRDNGIPGGRGQAMYNLWAANNRCPPEPMESAGLVLPRPGDMDCDGLVNNFDIDPFVLAISDAAAYEAAYPDCTLLNGDINEDGVVNNFDIDPFVALISGG